MGWNKMSQLCNFCVMTIEESQSMNNKHCEYCFGALELWHKQEFVGLFSKEWFSRLKLYFGEKESDYDAVIGLSGGIDSTYTAHILAQSGLKLIGFHVDCGWNSAEAINNIRVVSEKLSIPIVTKVLNWEKFKELQKAYLSSGVLNQDVPQDHLFPVYTRNFAVQKGVNKLISGWNLATESILPKEWSFSPRDTKQITHIAKIHGMSYRDLKQLGVKSHLTQLLKFRILNSFTTIKPLNWISFNRKDAESEMENLYGWQKYGEKHEESRWTKFHQGVILPEKWGIDKRSAHFSSMIVSGQMTRFEALKHLEKPIFTEFERENEMLFVAEKFNLSLEELENLLFYNKSLHSDFPGYHFVRNIKNKIKLTKFDLN